MSGPPRHSKPPPLPRPRGAGQRFDPSQPLLDIEDPATKKYSSKRNYKPEPVLPSLELPSRKSGQKKRGLGPVPMNDPLQDATALVSSPNAVIPMDVPSGNTQVAQVNTQVAPAPLPPTASISPASPIPAAAPTPAAIVPGRSGTRTSTPYIMAAVLAAATWGGAVAAYVLHQPEDLPEMAESELSPTAGPSSSGAVGATASASAGESGNAAGGEAAAGEAKKDAPPPAATWSASAEATPRALRLAGSTAVGSFQNNVVGYANGAQAWAYDGAHEDVFAMGDGSVAVVLTDKVVGLSAADGSERYQAVIPEVDEESAAVAAAANADHVLVALADARFVMITPAACGDSPAEGECVREVGKLSGEYLEPSSLIALGDDGMHYLAEEDAMRAFDMDHKTVFESSMPSDVRSMVRVPGGRIAVQFGQEAALLDPESCRGRSEVRLRTTGTVAPSGCVLWRYGRGLDPVPPSAVNTSSVALNERGRLQVVEEGDDTWKIPLGAFGPVAAGDGVLFTLAADGEALVVAEVDATNGSVKAKHPLPITATDEDRRDSKLLWSSGTLAASVGPHIAVLTLAQ